MLGELMLVWIYFRWIAQYKNNIHIVFVQTRVKHYGYVWFAGLEMLEGFVVKQ